MFRFSVLLLIAFSFPAAYGAEMATAPAATQKTQVKKKRKTFPGINYATVSFSFVSWQEKAEFSQGNSTAKGHANMFGNAFTFDHEHYFTPRVGLVGQFSYLIGRANVWSPSMTYQSGGLVWQGAQAGVRGAYRLAKWLIPSAGVFGVYRKLDIPIDSAGTSVTAGPSLNVGASADLRLRLNDHITLREEIGTLFSEANTYWDVAIGYTFIY